MIKNIANTEKQSTSSRRLKKKRFLPG